MLTRHTPCAGRHKGDGSLTTGPSTPSLPVADCAFLRADEGCESGLPETESLPGLKDSAWEGFSLSPQREVAKELGDLAQVLRPRLRLVSLAVQNGQGVDAEALNNR